MKIAIAMSGGVDSSVAAALLLKQGNDIIGATMHHFQNSKYGFSENEGIDAAISDAEKVCKKLDIKHHVIELSKSFEKIVIQNFISEYALGRTPNPCTLCNPTIKWGKFLKNTLELGVDKIATGHYIALKKDNGFFNIYKAKDKSRDQSYMLWGLNQEQLSKTLFPLSDFKKSEVRKIAEYMKLPVHDKEDSQENCFIKGHYEDFLKKYIELKTGDIVLENGKNIGKHKGVALYTIGQRKGLNTPWHSALFVKKLDVKNNRVIVTDNPDDLLSDNFSINNINWISGRIPENFSNLSVQIRYNSKPFPIKDVQINKDDIQIKLKTPIRAITPGQSAVFYQDDLLLGGGIIR